MRPDIRVHETVWKLPRYVLNEALAGLSLIKNSGIEKAVTYLNSIKPEPYEKKLDA